MSVRTRRQRALVLFVGALIVAVIAGAAGFATGYGAEASKRLALSEENRILKEENASLSGVKINIEETESLKTENEELKSKITELNAEIESLNSKISETEAALSDTQNTLTETEGALSEAEKSAEELANEVSSGSHGLMNTITKWFIFGIIAVLVIMGVAMFIVPKSHRHEDDEDYDEDEEYQEVTDEKTEIMIEEPTEEITYDEPEEVEEVTEEKGAKVPETLEELMMESSKGAEE